MAQSISQRELRNDSARILRAVDEGQSFVITRYDKPVGELIPLHRERLVDRNTVTRMFAGSPTIESDAFFRDLDEFVEQDIDPRV